MKIPGLLFLAGHTARSQTYAQAMAHHGLEPETVLLYGSVKRNAPESVRSRAREWKGLFLPDLDIGLIDTARREGWSLIEEDCETTNHPRISEHLERMEPELVLFSGSGGLVGRDILRAITESCVRR